MSSAERIEQLHHWNRTLGRWYGRAEMCVAVAGVLLALGLGWLALAALKGTSLWIALVPISGIMLFSLFRLWRSSTQTQTASDILTNEIERNMAPLKATISLACSVEKLAARVNTKPASAGGNGRPTLRIERG